MAELEEGRPSRLRVEGLRSPRGLTLSSPRFSWWLPAGCAGQEAYQLQVGDWDSGRVTSGDTHLVATDFVPSSLQEVTWRVRIWSDQGESGWSDLASFTAGLLDAAEWTAQWVRPVEADPLPAGGHRPAYRLRGRVELSGDVVRATLLATAHGLYEAFVNGTRVGDLELTPGSTAYAHTLQVQSYDVTDLVRPGDNELAALLSDGWFRSVSPHLSIADGYGSRTAFLAQLHVEHADGTVAVVGTGADWVSAPSEITAVEMTRGQHEDRLRAEPSWSPVRLASLGYDTLTGTVAPPVRRVAELRPVSVRRLANGNQVVDVGQNINGWLRLHDCGPAGTTVTLTHGEALDATGEVTIEHLHFSHLGGVAQTDSVVSAGDRRPFEGTHTTKGFRYVSVEGHPDDLTVDDVTAVVVHTDLEATGSFTCSAPDLERLHEITVRSFLGNACDVPTDCPTRERAGWTGDWQLFFPTAAFLHDVAGFDAKWLRDLASQQYPDGELPNMIPDRHEGIRHTDWEKATFLASASGWGDAAVHVPWQHWLHYADRALLERLYPHMVRWVECNERVARERRHPARTGPVAPHEEFLLDGVFQFGEWLEPGDEDSLLYDLFTLKVDLGVVGTAYFCRSAAQVAAAAEVLGRPEDADRFAALADNVREAWQTEYLATDGTVAPPTQATYVRALAFDLVPSSLRPTVVRHLVEVVRAAGTHVGTGFLATPMLLPALADNGHLDVAYDLLLQRSAPSWLAMLDLGATTVWERWDGLDQTGRARSSLNHYSKGAVISFLHTHVAGITLVDPAYRRFRVAPRPGGGLTWAAGRLETPHGPVGSSWRLVEGQLHLEVTVAPGTAADVLLPDGTEAVLGPGIHRLSTSQGAS